MLRCLFSFFLVVISFQSLAQGLDGMVMDKDNKTSIAGVTVLNKRTGAVVFSDGQGNFSIEAHQGDTITFRHTAFQPASEVVPFTLGVKFVTVNMQARIYKLNEATITSRTKYQQDSIEMQKVYGHELAKPPVPAPKYTGLGVTGLFGWAADKLTGNSKKPKRFKKQFAQDEQSKFIDSRYTPELVGTLTKMTDPDSIGAFMGAYPMPYDFARATTDLEMKGWIRNNFKEYKTRLAKQPTK